MQSIKYIPASNQATNASQMTVQTLRAPGATSIITNTVSGVPNFFFGSMGAPHTFTDPVTGETITVISESTAVDFAGTINSGHIDIVAIAPGYTDTRGSLVGDIVVIRPVTEWANNIFNVLSQAHNDDGSLKAAAITYNPNIGDYAQSGGVLSFTVSTLTGAMSALTLWQGGYLGSIAAVVSRTYTASKDTYVDALRTLSGYTNTFTLVYTEVANGAAAPALAANSIRLGKVVSGASAITSVVQFGRDSLNNIIYPNGAIGGGQLDASGFMLNVKSAQNAGTITPINGDNDFASSTKIQFTVAAPCVALVFVSVASTSTTDFEMRPEIWLDGVIAHVYSPQAALGNGSGRSFPRSSAWAVPIPTAGAHVLSPGMFLSAGAGYGVAIGGVEITAIILGKVTA